EVERPASLLVVVRDLQVPQHGARRHHPPTRWRTHETSASSTATVISDASARRYPTSAPMSASTMPSSATDRSPRVGAPEDLRAEHPDDVDEHDVEDHRFGRGGADADRAAFGVIAVVAADEHDRGGHDHALDAAVGQIGRVL